ncbi:hypothetical protein N7532_003052 [Penicillium argentinense]|uniref:C2H2-type domain-containing protein n=1 Tax=Penicillium argentinense TaxID=1131581 RepID=A0A9W9KE92_9EURO|nr:uncharacterized protein N7532_003052 [Penicillium argentinense]KAJ5102523.1 hypothetical protein N7532_003052 [Penicillium argentinense]
MDQSFSTGTPGDTSTGRRKPRNCQFCKRQFRRHEHLQRHLRIHTNEKPYKCACGASFGRRDLLKRHQKIGHSPDTPAPSHLSPNTLVPSTTHQPQADQGSVPERSGSLWELPDLHHTATASGIQQGDVPDLHFEVEGDILFNHQDLLVLQDLESFSQNMGLNTEWYLPTEPSITQIFTGEPSFNALPIPSSPYSTQAQHPQSRNVLSKLPVERENVAEFGVLTFPILTVTNQHRNRLLHALPKSSQYDLPSCHSLTRFMNGFFDGFYPHMPVVHIPTFKIEDCEPEIFLAMSALGAQYRHEHRKAVLLFYAAKDTLQQISDENEKWLSKKRLISRAILQDASGSANWKKTPDTLIHISDWHEWVQQESDRRLKLFSFAILNLHSIAFSTPPVIMSDEINLRLPCTCLEWIAPNQTKWTMVRRSIPQDQMLFQDAVGQLMQNSAEESSSGTHLIPSPLANYILLHALIQRIILAYQAFRSFNDNENTLMNGQKELMRSALHAWTSQWQRAPESSLDPRNPNGPVTFTSTALLGLAYVRLGLDLGLYKILRSREASEIANRLLQMPSLPAGPHLLPAILHATHALSIPVKLGVSFVARSHAFVWSIQHSLCGFEFAIFLSKWLFRISESQNKRPLDEHETRLIGWISDIVEEGRTSGDEDLWPRPEDLSNCVYLGYAVVKLWARLIRGNEQWAILKVIGDGLDEYGDRSEASFAQSQGTI